MLNSRLQSLLTAHESQHLLRVRTPVLARDETHVIVDGKSLINFCSNDYLNLSTHPDVIAAFIKSANEFGLGSGSSPAICGYSRLHQQLEEAFAEFLKRDRAILFNSGYHANLGVISALANRETDIIADKLCHASIIDGIVLSRAKHRRYQHSDIAHARALLHASKSQEKLLITESVFSMEGNIAPVCELAQLAAEHRATFIVDDAHGIGVLGKHGAGICEHLQLSQHDVPCLIAPLGKSPGGFGAVVSGSHELIETLLQLSRTYRYSTAMPAAICAATLTALTILSTEYERREKLQSLIQFFVKEALQRNLPLTSTDLTPIKSILTGSNLATLEMQKTLMARGFFVSCIRPPTVPKNKARIRISLTCAHTETQITQLLDVLAEHHEQSRHTN